MSKIVSGEEFTRAQKVKKWFRKYFFEGQHLEKDAVEELTKLPENPTFHDLLFIKHRKYVAMLIPFLLIHAVWWSSAIRYNFFRWYHDYWHMPVVMTLGAFVGGMTSEGAGAVAFPVMTLILHTAPSVARDFAIMLQSIGMTSALVCIVFMKVRIESRAVFLGTAGAVPGFIIGIHIVDPLMTGPQKKMLFVAIWTAFAFALALLNSQKKRPTYTKIPEFNFWKGSVLLLTGVIGGIFDSFAGSGIDVSIFSVVTLLFRVSEKTATPTTVVLKGVNAIFGFYYRAVMMGDVATDSWRYFAVTVPVASFFAPLGALIGSHFHRQVVAALVYVLEAATLVGFLLNGPSWQLLVCGTVIILIGCVFFHVLANLGARLMEHIESREKPSLCSNSAA
ncbi:unnamed protein product [Caenorhabditis auriculariae]|uniref:Membrane transporter protein n=1 Tax=Caenorhabditis auriculariae TaxID=2777116 RepID=A0A8S1GYI7_9PELO|nr:unnamed protein product [Caenorhabditis auriculariae]